jgi:hypothetical protein
LLTNVGAGDGVCGAGVSPPSLLVEQAAAETSTAATTTERKICTVVIEPPRFYRLTQARAGRVEAARKLPSDRALAAPMVVSGGHPPARDP